MRQQAHDQQRNTARTARSFVAAKAARGPKPRLSRGNIAQEFTVPRGSAHLSASLARRGGSTWSSWFSGRTAGSRFPPGSAPRPPPYAVCPDPERLSRMRAQSLGKDWHGPECGVIGVRVPRWDIARRPSDQPQLILPWSIADIGHSGDQAAGLSE
jgi:hypothetical protein